MSKKREYDEEYKVQAIELAKNLSGNPLSFFAAQQLELKLAPAETQWNHEI